MMFAELFVLVRNAMSTNGWETERNANSRLWSAYERFMILMHTNRRTHKSLARLTHSQTVRWHHVEPQSLRIDFIRLKHHWKVVFLANLTLEYYFCRIYQIFVIKLGKFAQPSLWQIFCDGFSFYLDVVLIINRMMWANEHVCLMR